MGFLSGWNTINRERLVIQSANISENLINYPILVHISTSSGINSTDLSGVFDELTSDANRFKIAVTSSDGITELPVEIERWDDANEVAWLWVKVPVVSSINTTILYFYYDSSHADNTNVGDVGDAIAQTIWDSNYLGVWHYNEDPSGSAPQMLDSTSNGNNGTSFGSMASGDLVDALIGKGLSFSSGKGINFGDSPFDISGNEITLEAIINATSISGFDTIVQKECTFIGYNLILSSGKPHSRINAGNTTKVESPSAISTGQSIYLTAKYDGSDAKIFEAGVEKASTSKTGNITTNAFPLTSGAVTGTPSCNGRSFDGIITEVRVSDIARSTSYIRANNFNFNDTLIDYSTSSTTFRDLISEPSSKKIQLAEIQVAERVDNIVWTQHGTFTNVWSITYFTDSITLQDGTIDEIRKHVNSVELKSIALTILNTLSEVDTTVNSFFHDVSNTTLYVNVNGNPETAGILITLFTLYFSSHVGIIFGNIYYEPYIKSAPSINSASQTLLSGFAQTTAGTLILNNDNGYFDKLIELYLWENRTVTIRYGGDSLPFEEYEISFIGIITNRAWSFRSIILSMKSKQSLLLRRIPENVFETGTFGNMDQAQIGNPIPIAYGTFIERTAPVVTAIDESDNDINNKVQFQITSHINNSIDNVWVDYNAQTDDEDAGWKQLTLDASLSSTDTYAISDDDPDNFNKITVRFQNNGYETGRTRIKVAFKGTEDSDGNLITSPSDIVKDILKTHLGFSDSDLNLPEFANSKTNSTNTISIYLNKFQRSQEVIDRIAVGEPAKFFIDNEGLFVLNVWSPDTGVTFFDLGDTDNLGMAVKFDSTEFFNKVKVGYNFSYSEGNWLYQSKTEEETKHLYKEEKQKIIHTYLDNSSDASILAQRYAVLLKTPTAEVSFDSKWQLSQKKITDRIRLTINRAPESLSGSYTGKIFEITAMSRDFNKGRIKIKCEDLKGVIINMGQWMGASAPSWSSATDAQKDSSGFWMNSSGQATSGDPTSLNRSIWF